MRIKRFEARTSSAALALVREALGASAVVLETRRTERGVEVLAASERPAAPPAPAPAVAGSRRLGGGAVRLCERLEACGFSSAVSERIAAAAETELGEGGLDDPRSAMECVGRLVALMTPTDTLPRGDGPSALALVGAPGAGKTTTLAKIAARTRIEDGRPVVLATADTQRLGGAEQAEAWARLLDAEFVLVGTAADVARARDRAGERGLLLIDTPGVSARDERGARELASLLEPLEPHEIELVLAADRDAASLGETVRRFRPARPGAITATRLDEACRRGAIASVVARSGLPLRHLGCGTGVPEDLALADSALFAAWSLERTDDDRRLS